jgi:hypothetical protein
MEERMNAVQMENANLLEILHGMQAKIKALKKKPATNIPAPRTTTYASVVNSSLPPRLAANHATTSGNNTKTHGNKNDMLAFRRYSTVSIKFSTKGSQMQFCSGKR